MAYGSHHHITNVKWQNLARETLLFASSTPDQPPWQEQLADIVMLTREAYSLNLGQVNLGERVAILTTYEDPTRSTVRLCFRIVHESGAAVSCGYQTMILVHRVTGELVKAPPMMQQFLDAERADNLLESLREPSFAERLHSGAAGVKAILSPEMLHLGRQVANAPRHEAHARILDLSLREHPLGGALSPHSTTHGSPTDTPRQMEVAS